MSNAAVKASSALERAIPTRFEILTLYRNILKGRRTFKYTDANWYTKQVQQAFRKNKELIDGEILIVHKIWCWALQLEAKIAKYFADGTRFYENKWGQLM